MIFSSDDIIMELWKHLSVDTFKNISMVSKNYNSRFKNMTDIHYISLKYKETGSNLTAFVSKTCKEICKKNNYPNPYFIKGLCLFLDNKVSEEYKNGIEDDIYFYYYWIIILLHSVNNNYKKILTVINKIDYNKQVNKNIILLFLKFFDHGIWMMFNGYSPHKFDLLRYISVSHMILLSKNQYRTLKEKDERKIKFVETIHLKQKELVNQIRKIEIFPGRWLHPKSFCLKLIDILEFKKLKEEK